MPESVRTLAFADAQRGVWGAAWLPGSASTGLLVLGTGDESAGHEVALEVSGETWRLQTDEVELVATPQGAAVELVDQDGAPAGSERLCAVTLSLGPGPELRATGRRGEHPMDVAPDRLELAREVSAWFHAGEGREGGDDGDARAGDAGREAGDGVAVLAWRARKQRGHEQDAIRAVLIEAEHPPSISDPRLSTTYAASGRPTRMTLELWSEDPEQYPRRFAGEAAGRGGQATGGGWTLDAELLRCHSRGRDGTGVYVLARPA